MMTRADVLTGFLPTAMRACQSAFPVQKANGNLYLFYMSSIDNGLYWVVSYDGGFTWSAPSTVSALGSGSFFSVWADQWTPGDTGVLVHIAFANSTNDDVIYKNFNLTDETLSSETTIFAGTSTASVANVCISITKAIGGNLYCAFDLDGGTETGFYRSTDAGATWGARTDVNEPPGSDYYYLVPGYAADTQDIMCIYWDRSASEISRKIYDDSGNSWAETSIATSMTSIVNSTCAPQFAVTVDDLNNKIILVAWTNRNTVNADLLAWKIDESAITALTDVVLNSGGNQQMCAIGLATDTADLYAFYGGKSDGSETAGTSIHIYYKISTDDGATWGSETQLSLFPRNFDFLLTCPVFTGDFFTVYEQQASTFDSYLHSVLLPTAGSAGGSPIMRSSVIT